MKKNQLFKAGIYFALKKILLTMRIILVLSLVCFMQSFATESFSQTARISISSQEMKLEKILLEIENQTKYRFAYNRNKIDVDKQYSANFKDSEINDVLDKLFRNSDISYTIIDRQIVLSKKSTEQTQQKTISGRVTDSSGVPLPGVTVVVKGTTIGTITDSEGNYNLANVPGDASLVYSFIGMKQQEVKVEGKTLINTVMGEETIHIEEVVAVGYGSMKKSDLTGSVATVKGEEISQISAGNFETLLQGKVAGLHIINSNNDNPQGGATVRIRGMSSINGSNSPLVVVDGIPIGDAGGINAVNPNIIESVEVLKDASATAIYGSRGANGVMLITTKRGSKGQPTIWLNQKTNFSIFSKRLNYWKNPLEMAELTDEGRENAGLDPLYIGQKDTYGTYYPMLADIESGAWPYHTDWPDYIFRDPAITTDTNLGVQGGSNDNQYYMSLGYYDGEGMQKKDDYEKISFDLSYEHTITDYLKVRTKSGFFRGKRNMNYGMDYSRNPLYPVYNGDGSYYKMNSQDYGNPLSMTNERIDKSSNTDGYATLQIDLDLAEPLQLVLRGDTRAGESSYNFFNPPVYTYSGDLYNGEGGINKSTYTDLQLDGYLTYSKIIAEDHNLTAMIGGTYEKSVSKGLNTTGRGFSNSILKEENMAGAETKFINNSRSETVLASGFGRINYIYRNRYLLTMTARADGSSKFGENNKWGFFPSGAISWRLSEENFIRQLEIFDQLKLRASYGVSGNQGISPYQTISQFGQDYYYLNEKEYIIYGIGKQIDREGLGNKYVTWGGIGNKDLRWEKTAQFDIGLDMTLLNNRLSVTIDYYNKQTKDLLRQQYLNPSSGFDKIWTNDGEIENKGFEFSMDGQIITNRKLQFDAGFIFNLNRNKVLNIGSQKQSGYIKDANGLKYEPYGVVPYGSIISDAYLNILAIGHPINSFYGYQVDGIIQGMPDNPTKMTQPGELNYIGLMEEGTLDPDARVIIGDPNPDFTSSLNFQFRHQCGLDLSMMFYLVYGNDIFSNRKLNRPSLQKDRWTDENPNNSRPSLRADRQYFASSWFVEDGTFLRLQNIALGYTFPKIRFLQSGRIYLNVSNPVTFSNTSEYDAEVNENGWGTAPYPKVAVFTMGLELKF